MFFFPYFYGLMTRVGICCVKSAHIWNDTISFFFVSFGGNFGMEGKENKLNMITITLEIEDITTCFKL